jgi:hypothetical protein
MVFGASSVPRLLLTIDFGLPHSPISRSSVASEPNAKDLGIGNQRLACVIICYDDIAHSALTDELIGNEIN